VFELLRVSELLSELRSALLSEFWLALWPDRWNPLFELAFPNLDPSRPLSADLTLDPAAVVPRVEKKCWFCATFRVVEAAPGRPLAEKLSRPGVAGTLPVLKRAFWNCA